MNNKLIVKFTDDSHSFTNGVEFGRILQQIEDSKDNVDNHGFPIHIENKEVLKNTCYSYDYIPVFGVEKDGWVEFFAIKNNI